MPGEEREMVCQFGYEEIGREEKRNERGLPVPPPVTSAMIPSQEKRDAALSDACAPGVAISRDRRCFRYTTICTYEAVESSGMNKVFRIGL